MRYNKNAMGKHKKGKSKKSKHFSDKDILGCDFSDYLAVMPGTMMCLMLFIMLILDIFMPGMPEEQFTVFPGIFTVLDYMIIACGIIHICLTARRKELRFEKTDMFFATFALLILVSTLVNGFNFMTIDGVPYRFIGIFNMLSFMLIYMGVTRSIKTENPGEYILTGYLIVSNLIGTAVLCDLTTGCIGAFHGKKELSAVFFNGNHYGYYLLMAILIGLAYFLFGSGRTAIIGAASAALNMLLLVINHSLGSILALIIVLFCTGLFILIKDRACLRKFSVLTAVVLAAFAVALIISPALRKEFTGLAADLAAIFSNTAEGSVGHRRFQMWTLTTGYIAEKPLLGYGCEGIAFMLYEAMKVSDPHCEILAYAAYYGIPAAIMYTAGVIGVIVTCIGRTDTNGVQQKAACMAAGGYFLSSLVGVGMFYTLPFFFIFLGLSVKH